MDAEGSHGSDAGNELYARFIEGDENALLGLVKTYRPGLRSYINGMVRDIETADELTQETFVKLCLKRPKNKGLSSFRTWLYTIGRNVTLDHLRREARKRSVSMDDCFDIPEDAPTPEESLCASESAVQVRGAIGRLSPEHRQILYLLYFEGFSIAEAALILGKSSHNTSALLYRAKKALKAELEKEGFTCENGY